MHSETGNILSNENIAQALGLKIDVINDAWKCFEDLRLIKKRYKRDSAKTEFDVIFVDLRESLFGNGGAPTGGVGVSTEKNSLGDDAIQKVFEHIESIIGKPIPGNDFQKIAQMLELPGLEPDLISFAYSYCVNRGKPATASYVGEIVRNWTAAGVLTEKQAVEYLESVDVRYEFYKKIMKSLGLRSGNITDAEKKVFDKWIDEYGFTLEEILTFAEKGTGMDNKFLYVKKVIKNEYERINRGSKRTVAGVKGNIPTRKEYYDSRKRENEEELRLRCEEIYSNIPEMITLDEEIKSLNMESISAGLSKASNKDSVIKHVKSEMKEKTLEKKNLLEANGYSLSDMEIKYHCNLCKDTGIQENESSCSCYTSILDSFKH